MTTVNPIFIYELIKQKVNWNTKLTPVARISDFVETFNTSSNLNLIVSGKNIAKVPQACKNGTTTKDVAEIENLGSNVKTVIIDIKNVCIANGTDLRVDMDLYGYDKKLGDLLSDKESEEALLTMDNLNKAIKKDKRSVSIKLGKVSPDMPKKDVLGLLITLLQSEYNKVDPKLKDGNLKLQILNEIGLLISDGQKYVELLDATNLISDQTLCDVSDSNINNTMTITTITKYGMLNEGKTFCVDIDIQSFFTQSRITTIDTTNVSRMTSGTQARDQNNYGSMKEMMDNVDAKNLVLESYVSGLLDQVYKDKNKYKVEILRPSSTTFLIKITDNQSKEVFFNKVDITNAISDASECKDEKTDSRIREYVSLQKYCKGSNFYKVQFLINGSEHTKISSKKIPFAKLQEAKDQKAFGEYLTSLHSAKPKNSSTTESPIPKSAVVIFNSPYNYYGGVYGGLYGLGLYGAGAGLYSYPRYGGVYGSGLYGSGLYGSGLYGGVYSYPYSYAGVYSSPYVYTPPLATSIVPTAPYIGASLAAPIVSAPIISTATPFTYNYPMITTSNYTLGSYYSPYLGYGGAYGYSYASPFQYTYSVPYTYIKSEDKRIKLEKEDVLPIVASSYFDLVSQMHDLHPNSKIEKIGMNVKIEIERNLIQETRYYGYQEGKLYLQEEKETKLI